MRWLASSKAQGRMANIVQFENVGLRYGMAWVRHHDKYEGAVVDPAAHYQEPKSSAASASSESCCD